MELFCGRRRHGVAFPANHLAMDAAPRNPNERALSGTDPVPADAPRKFASGSLCVLILLVAALFCGAAYGLADSAVASESDFSSYWLGAWWVRERPADIPLYYPGERPDRPNSRIWTMVRASRHDGLDPWLEWGQRHDFPHPKFYLYPPIFAVFFTPLTHLSVAAAARAWGVVNAAAFLLALGVLAFDSRPRTVPGPRWTLALLGISLLFYPTWWSIGLGQNTLLLFLPWCIFLAALRRGRSLLAGGMLGLLVMIKLSPVLLFPWLVWRRQYRTAAWTALTAAALLLLSVTAAGWESIQTYIGQIAPLLSSGSPYYENQSLPGFLLRLDPATDVMHAPPGVFCRFPFHLFPWIVLLFGIFTFWPQRRNRAIPADELMREGSAWMLMILLTSPVSWSHHMVNALPALAFGVKSLWEAGPGQKSRWMAVGLFLSYVLQAIPTLSAVRFPSFPLNLLLSHRLLGVLILWAILVVGMSRPPRGLPAAGNS